MHIVSLLPGTTEIVCALGKSDELVGRSHECDFPADVRALPICTEPKFKTDGISYEIDQRVKALLQEGLSVYRVDENKLADLEPDVIITQDHCEACAASTKDVKKAVRSQLGDDVTIISVSPSDLSSVVNSIRTIARAIDAEEDAEKLTGRMKSQLQAIQQKVEKLRRPKILGIEWMNPLMSAGNWVPELMLLAGGRPLGAQPGEHSPTLAWNSIRELNPDIITIMPCGYSIDKTLQEIEQLTSRDGWDRLRAVQNKQVFVLDGNHYFNRPGPRLVDSTRILGEILHPSVFRKEEPHPGWINLFHQTTFHNSLSFF
ncbi:MAG TPA: cobalamin-binding protein [Balneolaceae bacterium]|nr:cobalamin-binding protein [Balneolaceae bacterium]